ncbi:MAG TPA: DUF4920 domain-containing protein [Blastocatellia bacterium]|nr:DUF4920 domain-containing protein [Blastocatellia bacterium]
MMNRWIKLSFVIAALCVAAPALADHKEGKHFGAPFTDAKVVALDKAMADVDKLAGKTIKLEGEIKDVCQAKGCWLVITDGERAMRVSFKDYGFFVPKDAAGKKVVLEGMIEKKTISEMHAQHIAQESKEKPDPSAIKGPQQIITMVATGVEIKD